MTDGEKLILLERYESGSWNLLVEEIHDVVKVKVVLGNIERCQSIRAGLTQPVLKVTNRDNPVVYQKPSSGDEGF